MVMGTGSMGMTRFAPSAVKRANATASPSPAAILRAPAAGSHVARGVRGNGRLTAEFVGAVLMVNLSGRRWRQCVGMPHVGRCGRVLSRDIARGDPRVE